MRTWPWLPAGLAVLCLQPCAAVQQSVFRATTDAVTLHVAVRDGTRVVGGLTAGDFQVLDNGVSQPVAVADATGEPIDLTVVMDLGFLAHLSDAAAFRQEVSNIARALSPTDRLRVITAATTVTEVRPMLPPTATMKIDNPTEGGGASLNDALLDALAWPAADNRRDVVALFTRGSDTWSVLRSDVLPDVAARSDATLELVLVPLVASTGESIDPYPVPTVTRQALIDAAGRTGGDVFYIADAVSGVKHALGDVRQSYTLSYTLTGVPKPGWHEVTVKVTKPGSSGYKVRARKGYFVPQ